MILRYFSVRTHFRSFYTLLDTIVCLVYPILLFCRGQLRRPDWGTRKAINGRLFDRCLAKTRVQNAPVSAHCPS